MYAVESPLHWKIHPLKEYWVKSTVVILFLSILLTVIQTNFREILFTILAGGMLLISLLRYFFPTEYTLTNEGVQIHFLGKSKFRNWSEFQSFYVCRNGIQLSTFYKPNRLDSFRGHYILTTDRDKKEVIEFLRSKLKEV